MNENAVIALLQQRKNETLGVGEVSVIGLWCGTADGSWSFRSFIAFSWMSEVPFGVTHLVLVEDLLPSWYRNYLSH